MHVHICNLAAQTGASLFLHSNAPPFIPGLDVGRPTNWVYDKTENLSIQALTSSREITHLIAEIPSLSPSVTQYWTPVAVIDGFDGWRLHTDVVQAIKSAKVFDGLKALGNVLEMVRSEKLVILQRKA